MHIQIGHSIKMITMNEQTKKENGARYPTWHAVALALMAILMGTFAWLLQSYAAEVRTDHDSIKSQTSLLIVVAQKVGVPDSEINQLLER